jgi:hypothetical protein
MMAMISLGAMGTGFLLGLAALQAAAQPVPVTSDRRMFFRPYTPGETEILQRATSLAIGNLAWESVAVSEVRKTKTQIKWTATTRSNKYFCTADADGQNSFCDRP